MISIIDVTRTRPINGTIGVYTGVHTFPRGEIMAQSSREIARDRRVGWFWGR